MIVKTRNFGEVELDDAKVLHFENGLMGFEELRKFAIMYDIEDGEEINVSWLQSLEDEAIAIPIISPLFVMDDYKPIVDDELLMGIGEITEELVIFTTLRVPSDLTKMTTNLRAPIIINPVTKLGCQLIVENDEYEIRHNVYDVLQKIKKQKAGE